MEIGDRIKARREELGISQEELAKKVGYKSRSSVNKIEIDGRGLPQGKIVAFAKALQPSPAYLMGWTAEEASDVIADLANTALEAVLTPNEVQCIHKNSYENLIIKEMKKMNQKGKVKLLDTAREMICNPLYNPNYEMEVKAAHNDFADDEEQQQLMKEDLDEL